MKRTVGVLAGLALLLAGCSEADNDRESGSGKQPDLMTDATKVQIFRNADNVPNVVRFCADGRAFWSTLSGGDSNAKPPQLLRAPEEDFEWCGRAR